MSATKLLRYLTAGLVVWDTVSDIMVVLGWLTADPPDYGWGISSLTLMLIGASSQVQ